MNILIAGAAGFIGTNLTLALMKILQITLQLPTQTLHISLMRQLLLPIMSLALRSTHRHTTSRIFWKI